VTGGAAEEGEQEMMNGGEGAVGAEASREKRERGGTSREEGRVLCLVARQSSGGG
jgi:hypothetical protein